MRPEDALLARTHYRGHAVVVELLPRSPYEVAYTAGVGTVGFAFESQRGTHALGSDRRVPFYTRPNTLAYVPPGCDVYSQSSGGGEYLHIRAPGWTPAGARQINDVAASGAIGAAHAIRCALLTGREDEMDFESSIAILIEVLSVALAPDQVAATYSRSLTTRRLRLIDELIDERLQERLSVTELAQSVGLSVGYLIRAFRHELGVTPHAYVMDRRVSRARQLLREPSTSIAGVAASCGFASQAHLAAVFKRTLRVTPRSIARGGRHRAS